MTAVSFEEPPRRTTPTAEHFPLPVDTSHSSSAKWSVVFDPFPGDQSGERLVQTVKWSETSHQHTEPALYVFP